MWFSGFADLPSSEGSSSSFSDGDLLSQLPAEVLMEILRKSGSTERGILRHTNRGLLAAVNSFAAGEKSKRRLRMEDLCRGLRLLKWSFQQGAPWQDKQWRWGLCPAIARRGDVECFVYARCQMGFPWFPDTCASAAAGGHLELLAFARDGGCHWDGRTCEEAAAAGHFALLRWAVASGCPMDERTCEAAARGGHLAILKWARSQGCPWSARTCENAAKAGHLEVLRWAVDEGCPCYPDDYKTLANASLAPGSVKIPEILPAANEIPVRHSRRREGPNWLHAVLDTEVTILYDVLTGGVGRCISQEI